MNEKFEQYLKSFPVNECLVISVELNTNCDLILVMDNVTKFWERHYNQTKTDSLLNQTRWFQKFTFPNCSNLKANDHNGQISLTNFIDRFSSASICINSFHKSGDEYEIEFSGVELDFVCSGSIAIEERELGVKRDRDRWIYFDIKSNKEVPFDNPFLFSHE